MIELYTDYYYQIGASHLTSGKPCQDYAISDVVDGAAWGVISDGCSTGGHTDVGSRVLALSTSVSICEDWKTNRVITEKTIASEIDIRRRMVLAGIRQSLGLNYSDMLATCIYAYISPLGGFVNIQGDGVLALKYRNEKISVSRFDWEKNTPFYPTYRETGALGNFIKLHGGDLTAKCFSKESLIIEPGVELNDSFIEKYSLSEGIRGITIDIPLELLNDIEFIAVFSDGVTQIDGIDWRDAIVKFLSFKNLNGEFAKRRMIKEIKDTKKIGKGPIDDISYAVIMVKKVEDDIKC